ncbi:MAG: DUF4491 family protein [Bacteroidales bacterium]|nr:DUF4491 family protein [Bacteroidales bacterium]
MNWEGIVIGAATFLCIGVFHPIVIKAEYYLGTRSWWLFALAGAGCIAGSLLTEGTLSTLLGVVAFSSLWSILELFKQEKRVERGWFPRNPKRRQK